MAMNTLRNHAAARKNKSLSKKRAQSIIPIKQHFDNNMFFVDNLYVKTYEFENTNFKLLSKQQEEQALKNWWETLNTLEPGVAYRYTILKRNIDLKSFYDNRILNTKNDGKDEYREEYNKILKSKLAGTNLLEERRYFQVSTAHKNSDEATAYFERAITELDKGFKLSGSKLYEANTVEYLKTLYSFFHPENNDFFGNISLEEMLGKKGNIKNFLAPFQYESNWKENYIKVGGKYYRALYVPPSGYGQWIRDTIVDELISTLNKQISVSIDIFPLERLEAHEMIENLEFKNELNIQKITSRQNKSGNYNGQIPYKVRKKAETIEEYNTDINERDQRLMLSHITIMHTADTLEDLNADTEKLKATARRTGCELVELTLQQEDGIITALPFGVNRFIDKTGSRLRTLTTEGLTSFIPFTVKEIAHQNGIYYGVNKHTKTPIFINRKEGMNGNAILTGSSGSGKSLKIKEELIPILLNTDDYVILIDPEREYTKLVEEFGGQVVNLAPNSGDHINALEISSNYDDNDPMALKSEMVLTLYAMAAGSTEIDSRSNSIIDRCLKNVYHLLAANGYQGEAPTLNDLRNELLDQPEGLAEEIALTLELYTEGSLNLFSKPTNVDMSNRLICFDISEVGETFMPIAMLVVTDFITNTLSRNKQGERWTHVIIDELYLMFKKEYTAIFFHKLWKRIRKVGGLCTGLTQEFGDILNSKEARTLFSNSDFIIMLSASADDSILIQELLRLDENQMDYIREVGVGNGMIKLGNNYVPFVDQFPENTKLFKLISTKFGD